MCYTAGIVLAGIHIGLAEIRIDSVGTHTGSGSHTGLVETHIGSGTHTGSAGSHTGLAGSHIGLAGSHIGLVGMWRTAVSGWREFHRIGTVGLMVWFPVGLVRQGVPAGGEWVLLR